MVVLLTLLQESLKIYGPGRPTKEYIKFPLRTKKILLQAVGVSSISILRTVMRELGRGELGVGGKAHYGGAYDRTQVRTRVNAGAWQGLQRRLKAPSHRAAPALPT